MVAHRHAALPTLGPNTREETEILVPGLPEGMYSSAEMVKSASLVGLALLAACTGAQLTPIPSPPDGGMTILPNPDAGAMRTFDFREDFSNTENIETSSVAIVDVNYGTVSLPAATFKDLPEDASGILNLSDYAGAVRAGVVVVGNMNTLEGPDSIDLRAHQTVRIAGRVHAGAGGVNISAGDAIYVDGIIDSDGPIFLEVTSETGRIEINGRVQTLDATDRGSQSIRVTTRGEIKIAGNVTTGSGVSSGDIWLESYGPISIWGRDAVVAAGASSLGKAGSVRIATEAAIDIESATVRGGQGDLVGNARVTRGGDVILRGEGVLLAARATISAGDASDGTAGRVEIVSAGEVGIRDYSQVLGGSGRVGGRVSVEARTGTISATLVGGDGIQTPGWVVVGTAGPLSLGYGAQITAGGGECTQGGDAVLLVAGRLFADGDPAVTGGRGGGGQSPECAGAYPGGNVQVTAQELIGPVEAALHKGPGRPEGTISVRQATSFTRPLPDIRVRVEGFVVSRPIDRGGAGPGRAPLLREVKAATPPGTFVIVQLAAADDPEAPPQWHDVPVGTAASIEELVEARSLRYRVFLSGRALDAPELDYFDLSLTGL